MVREPILTTVAIADLRPTQITVGMREVMAKRKHWRETPSKKGEKFLGRHMIPVILGPKQRHYVIDHHHLARALHDEGVKEVAGDRHCQLGQARRRRVLDRHGQSLVDASLRCQGRAPALQRHSQIGDRSGRRPVPLARRRIAAAGGFAKDTAPFSEFLWADFLRRRIKRKLVESNFEHAVEKAMQLAKSEDAGYLPGWCGPVPEE